MGNPFVHVELNTTDPGKAKSFYSQLFTWKMADMPMGPDFMYTTIDPEGGTGGGLMQHPMPGAPSMWLAYALVDDVKATTEKARSLGATIIKDVSEVPNMGWFSIIMDPTGAALGLGLGATLGLRLATAGDRRATPGVDATAPGRSRHARR
jgi:predicted enzyme related to lactoylglutathione lyase